jgi:hypothetical protein
MKHDLALLEKYAMEVLKRTEPLGPADMVDVDAAGAAIGLTPMESRQLAYDMQQKGWAIFRSPAAVGLPAKVELTLHGKEEIAKFRLPKWRRWVDANPGLWVTILAPILSLASAILVKLLERWLGLK